MSNPKTIEVRCAVSNLTIEQREADSPSRTISGYAAIFEEWSDPIMGWFREKISRGAFDGADFSKCIMCFDHDASKILARVSSGTLEYEVDNRGLHFRFEAPNTTLGNDMLELARRGDITQCSFRFIVSEDAWVYTPDGELDERTIVSFDSIYDLSLVVYPAYPQTNASVEEQSRSLYEARKSEWLAAQKEPTDEQRAAHAETAEAYIKATLMKMNS